MGSQTLTQTVSEVAEEHGQAKLTDPTLMALPAAPAFPLEQNELQDLMEYKRTPEGQLSTVSRVNAPRGSHLCYVRTQISVPESTWSSFQTSKSSHAEFNSALVYMNHSCAPTVELEVFAPDSRGEYPNGVSGELRVVQDRDLRVGDELTWFYPSTEFISPRPFECLCGAGKELCIGTQRGSNFLSEEVLSRYFINNHVRELRAQKRAKM
ncbi:hypothetical protein N7539_002226 [Penicillium diatomitis]|uniref:SET domain-containing protein n=1 Tax=Penicillium diatomitis TaxID=2819901 RepID=A0A9X0C0U2_9EURO|nr:uncharacterized protein N7539_002226 [Penicillium diatomitis]KAJ5493480.1 hypothetical protein N7539_002226 [Penicillium diatomitis]